MLCRVCRARSRVAILETKHWQTGELNKVARVICPCIRERHQNGEPYIAYPPNFIRWADEGE